MRNWPAADEQTKHKAKYANPNELKWNEMKWNEMRPEPNEMERDFGSVGIISDDNSSKYLHFELPKSAIHLSCPAENISR